MMPLQERSGETSEFLGDAVCGLSVAAYLKSRYPDEDEGFLTMLRTRLVCGSKLGEFAEKLGLPQHMVISRYIEKVNNGRSKYKILEDVFESFVGSMFEDTGYDFYVVHRFITRVMEKFADIVNLIANDTNYKDQLLRYYQQSYAGAFPVYKELSVTNDADGKIYEMSVLSPDGSQVIATGKSHKKRVSEQYASRVALVKYGCRLNLSVETLITVNERRAPTPYTKTAGCPSHWKGLNSLGFHRMVQPVHTRHKENKSSVGIMPPKGRFIITLSDAQKVASSRGGRILSTTNKGAIQNHEWAIAGPRLILK